MLQARARVKKYIGWTAPRRSRAAERVAAEVERLLSAVVGPTGLDPEVSAAHRAVAPRRVALDTRKHFTAGVRRVRLSSGPRLQLRLQRGELRGTRAPACVVKKPLRCIPALQKWQKLPGKVEKVAERNVLRQEAAELARWAAAAGPEWLCCPGWLLPWRCSGMAGIAESRAAEGARSLLSAPPATAPCELSLLRPLATHRLRQEDWDPQVSHWSGHRCRVGERASGARAATSRVQLFLQPRVHTALPLKLLRPSPGNPHGARRCTTPQCTPGCRALPPPRASVDTPACRTHADRGQLRDGGGARRRGGGAQRPRGRHGRAGFAALLERSLGSERSRVSLRALALHGGAAASDSV
jgi:hypothetical protein